MQANTIVVITDNTVKKYYGSMLLNALKKFNKQILFLSFPAGEKSKNIKTVLKIHTKMLKHYCTRQTLIIALGGGVVGDIAGFVAATYMRGIVYIQIPTTLLAMVDSSIGGKTGINMPQGKNLIGIVYPPILTLTCMDWLTSLPRKHIINGLVEALKTLLIKNSQYVDYFNRHLKKILQGDKKSLKTVVYYSTKIKIAIIKNDLNENGRRAVLNLGHTIGHALEKISNYKILHGHAVAYGILFEAKLSEYLGILAPEKYHFIKTLMGRLGFNVSFFKKLDIHKIIKATYSDKKVRTNKVNYVLLQDIGKIYSPYRRYTHPVDDITIKNVYLTLIRENFYAR